MRGVGNLTRAAYAISAYDACSETSPKIMTKWSAMIALRGQSMWRVFIIHVLERAFGDASYKTW